MLERPRLTAIQTHCAACGNDGVTAWDQSEGFELDTYLQLLRSRCPDCGGDGRSVTVLAGTPNEQAFPELAEMWRELVAFVEADPELRAPRQGRNEPCACGSGKKFKRCCG
jgi:uncharacterized protein YchJ